MHAALTAFRSPARQENQQFAALYSAQRKGLVGQKLYRSDFLWPTVAPGSPA
jgi:hypothetical protein